MDLVQQMDLPGFRAEFLLDHKQLGEQSRLQLNGRWTGLPVGWADRLVLVLTAVEATHFQNPLLCDHTGHV